MGAEDYFRHCQSINLDFLRVYGRRYVAEHVIAAVKEDAEERRYRAYITDALMIITENTARYAGGKHLTKRWYAKYEPKDERTPDEIAIDVIKNAGLTLQGR